MFPLRISVLLQVLLLCAGNLAAQSPSPDLDALESKGQAEFSRRDCDVALKTFADAIRLAESLGQTGRADLYYLRTATCHARLGEYQSAVSSYRKVIEISEGAGHSEMLAAGLGGLAQTLTKMGRGLEAMPLIERTVQLADQCGHPAHRVFAMWLLAGARQNGGELRESLRLLESAREINRQTGNVATDVVLMDNLSNIYSGLGDFAGAMELLKEILAVPVELAATSSTTYSRALTWNNLGELELKSGHPAEARKYFELAVAGSQEPGNWRVRTNALLNLAARQNAAGQYAEADAGFREALAITRRVEFPDLECLAWQMRADDLLKRGDSRGALDAATASVRIARKNGSPERLYKCLVSLGSAELAAGAQELARAALDEAIGIGEDIRLRSPGEISDLTRAYANFIPLYQASVKNLLGLKLPEEAFQRTEQAKARVLMDLLRRGGVNEREVISRSESDRQEALRKRLSTTGSQGTQGQQLVAEYRQFRRTLYLNHPELQIQTASFEAAGPDKLAVLLPDSRTALLDYFFVPGGVVLFVIRRPSAGAAPAVGWRFLPDPRQSLPAEIVAFRGQVSHRNLGYKRLSTALYNRLLAPAQTLLEGTTTWIVSPDGPLLTLPFTALIAPSGRHVVETHSVSVTPSLTAALEIRARRNSGAAGRLALLALGNPLPSPVPLPDAAREVAEISALYPRASSVVLTGAAATASAFRARAAEARLIHLAAHAGLNDMDPLASFVRLGAKTSHEGVLTASEILSMRLRADLVVLSACETALGETNPGEGMIGMGWALSAAGASSAVISLWKVDSAATREFMTGFYGGFAVPLAKGTVPNYAGALRKAAETLRRHPEFRHPYYWAAFCLWGDNLGGTAL